MSQGTCSEKFNRRYIRRLQSYPAEKSTNFIVSNKKLRDAGRIIR